MAYSRRHRSYRRRTHRRRRDSRKCPKGTSRRIVGQRRRMVDGISRIVRHGRLSRKCYRGGNCTPLEYANDPNNC